MEYKDYYRTLGVGRNATDKEIRSAYRKLARQYHPDVNPGDKEAEAKFRAISEAYAVLSNPETRRKYDELGANWEEVEARQRAEQAARARGQPFGRGFAYEGAPGGARYGYRQARPEDYEDLFGGEPFSDFFQTFFGGGAPAGGRGGPRPGADVEAAIEVSLAEAYRGARRTIELMGPEGRPRRIEVAIPAGAETGTRIRLAGQGAPGQAGGAPGDLYLVVTVRPDPRFERDGQTLRTKVTAPLDVMVLGGDARVPTPDGRTLVLTVPPDTQDGRVFRLRGQGMPALGAPDRRGDLLAEVHVRLPEHPTARQRELLREFARGEAGSAAGVG